MDDARTNLAEFLRCDDNLAVMPPLVRLVAAGEPVPVPRLAAEAGMDAAEVETWLRAQPGTDWDEDGRLLGFGLTQRPTGHRFVVDGRELYTFCAADTLLFPPILGKPAAVTSTCHETGRTVRLEVTPDAVTAVEPASTVVSQVRLCGVLSDIRGDTCDHGHFFATDADADGWRRVHPDGMVLPVADFFAQGLSACHDLGWTSTQSVGP